MDSKPMLDQQYKCRTSNCAKSFKNASSLFRHNKCCVSFVKESVADANYAGIESAHFSNFPETAFDTKDKNKTYPSSSSNEVRDAACLCDPPDEQLRVETQSEVPTGPIGAASSANLVGCEEPTGRKNKKQVILNPDGKGSAIDCFSHEDLLIDESQAAKLESYSCYAGVPQRDKAGQFFVWVSSSGQPELLCVSRHARLYSQLLGRISSGTKKMDSKIVSLANSILENGHEKNSFDYRGLVQWSFIERLYATKSTEAKKLIQSFSGSASNRMRVIVGLCDASRVGKMRLRYYLVARPVWVAQLNTCLRAAVLNNFGGANSIRKLFYAQVSAWDGKAVTDDLVESMPFLRLLYLFHELGYFKASQVNRVTVEGGGDSVKWMSYFDEVEALCAVQAAFSEDFSFVTNEYEEGPNADRDRSFSSVASVSPRAGTSALPPLFPVSGSGSMSMCAASVPAGEPDCAQSDFNPLGCSSSSVVTEDGTEQGEGQGQGQGRCKKKNMERCWSVHVRAMCKACGLNVKEDKDRVCSDAWSSSESFVELSEADKTLAEKIIKLRNYAFLLWQVFDTPSDRRIFSLSHSQSLSQGLGQDPSLVYGGGGAELSAAVPTQTDMALEIANPTPHSHPPQRTVSSDPEPVSPVLKHSTTVTNSYLPSPLPLSASPDARVRSEVKGSKRSLGSGLEEACVGGKGPDGVRKKARDSKAELRRQIRDEDDITYY